MPSVAAVLADLAVRAPGDKAAAWDPHGLQIGDAAAEVMRLGICHEVSDLVVDRAIDLRLDLLISYHPLLFHPSNRWLAGSGPAGRAYRLLRSGVAVAVAHTAWDAARGGTGDALAAALGLGGVTRFGRVDPLAQKKLVTFVPPASADEVAAALSEAGAGRIGNYRSCSFRSQGIGTFLPEAGARPVTGEAGELNRQPEVRLEVVVGAGLEGQVVSALVAAHPYEEPAFDLYEVRSNLASIGRIGDLPGPEALGDFAARVAATLAASVRCSGDRNRMVSRVAVLPGSGGSLAGEAAAIGAEVYVTGDLSHHQTRESLDRGMSTIDPGHAATERPGVARLLAEARNIMPAAIDLTDDPTPWKES